MNTLIREFWDQKNFAVVGVSRRREKFGSAVFREMKKAGYDVVPVNRSGETIEGTQSYASLKQVPGNIGAAIVSVPPGETEAVLRQCAEKGIKHVWLQQGAESERAIDLAGELGLDLVHHECAFMFFPPAGVPHKLHKWVHTKISGHHKG